MSWTISKKGENFIKNYESCRLKAYQDEGGVWTIGWGHTGKEVKEGEVITQDEADALFNIDIKVRESLVNSNLEYPQVITQNQFDALVSFIYNVGSTGLDSILFHCINSGAPIHGALDFVQWNKVAGKLSLGLLRRRVEEMSLFLS